MKSLKVFQKIISSFLTSVSLYLSLSYFLQYKALAADLDEPTLGQMQDILVRVMNWLIFLVGVVFVVVIAYGAWKASTATGDPRGLDSAKSTWTYALFGALVVVGFFALFTIISGLFGFKIGFSEIFAGIFSGISTLTGFLVAPPQ